MREAEKFYKEEEWGYEALTITKMKGDERRIATFEYLLNFIDLRETVR
jgi:hypothetical protein